MASASRLVAAAMDRRSALAVAAEAPPSLPYAGNEPYALGLGVPPHLPPPPMDPPRSAPLKPPATGFLQFSGVCVPRGSASLINANLCSPPFRSKSSARLRSVVRY